MLLYFFSRIEPSEGAAFLAIVKGLVVLAMAQGALVYLLSRISNDVNIGPGLKRVRARIPVEDAVPVAITVVQKGTVTGADEGYMWLDEGTLFYKGLQCVFRLNQQDIKPISEWPSGRVPQPERGRDVRWLVLQAGARDCEVKLSMIDPFEDYAVRRRSARFQTALLDWLHDKPYGALESVLPPLDVHPSLQRSGKGIYEGLISGIALCAVNAGIVLTAGLDLSMSSISSLAGMLQASGGVVLFVVTAGFARQQHKDLSHRRAVFLENELGGAL